MKTMRIFALLTVMILYNATAFGQSADFYKQQIEVCLSRNDGKNAQIMYDAWKELTKKTDVDVERRIAETAVGYIEFKEKKIAVQAIDIGTNVTYEMARLTCENSALGEFNNWRLPGPDESMFLFTERDKIGNFTPNSYWLGEYDGNARARASATIRTRTITSNGYTYTEVVSPRETGVVYSETQRLPTLNNAKREAGRSIYGFREGLPGPSNNFKTNTEYYCRGYTIWENGEISYGDVSTITTKAVQTMDFSNGNIIPLNDNTKNTGRFNVRCVRTIRETH